MKPTFKKKKDLKSYLKKCCGYRCNIPQVIKTNLPGYVCSTFLGEGGFGATFLMRHSQKNPVALKVIQGLDKKTLDNEDKILQKLSSSCAKRRVLCYKKRFSEGDVTYFVTEYIDGMSLDTYLQYKETDIYKVLAQLIDAVEYIHSRGIVHFDIKPDNVMVTKKGDIKLIDFGGASLQDNYSMTQVNAFTQYFAPPNVQRQYFFKRGTFFDWYTVMATTVYLLKQMKKIPIDLKYLTSLKDRDVHLDFSILKHIKKLKNTIDLHINSKSKSFIVNKFNKNARKILEKRMKSV